MSNLYQNIGPHHNIQKFYKGFESYASSKDIKNQKNNFCKPLGIKPNISSPQNDYAEYQKEIYCEIENWKFNPKEKYKYNFEEGMNVPNFDGFKKGLIDDSSEELNHIIYSLFDGDCIELIEAEQNMLQENKGNELKELIEKIYNNFNLVDEIMKYENIKKDISNSFQAKQNLSLENEEKEIYNDCFEKKEKDFNLDNENMKYEQQKKDNSSKAQLEKKENEFKEYNEKKEKDFNLNNESMKYEEIKKDNSNSFQAELEKKEKEKEIYNDCVEKKEKNFNSDNESMKSSLKIKNNSDIENKNKKIEFAVKSSDNFLLDNNQNKSLLSGEPETNNSFPDEQYPLLENKDKEFYKDYNKVIDNKFKLNIKRFKPSRKKKNSTKIGRRNKKIKLRVKSLPKFLLAKKDNYIKESANDDPEGKSNAHKKTNSEKKEGKNGGKKPGGERNSKNSTKIKEENNSFNDFELDILSSEFDKDFNELLSEKNYPCSLSEKDLSGHCPKERDKKYENSEEKKEGDSFDNFNIFNSKTSNKTYSMPNNPHLAFLEDSQNVSNLLNYSCKNFFRPSSDFFPPENLENFARFNSSNKNEGNDDLNDENKSFEEKLLFNKGKRKRKKKRKKIFSVSKIPKSNKKLNSNKQLNFENINNSCIIANKNKINQEFQILQNENNNKSMINCFGKKKIKKSTKKTKKNIFSIKKIIDNSNEKNKIIPINLSDIKNNDDSFIKKIRKKYSDRLGERLYEFDRTNIRKFNDYLSENKTLFEDIFSQNPNFWDDFFRKEKSYGFYYKIEDKEYKSCSIEFLKHIFSKDGVDILYEKFLSDIQYQNKIKEILKEKYDSYKNYQKDFHKIYGAKYKEELKLDD